MKKELALAAAFACLPLLLSFMACSGDSPAGSDHELSGDGSALEEQSSSSVPPQQSSSSVLPGDYSPRDTIKMSFKNCYERLDNKLALSKEAAEDLSLAYLYHEGDKYQLMIPKLYDYCGFEKVMMDVGRYGDTLKLEVTAMLPTACKCTIDHWFDIEARDADIKYFAHTPYNKKETVYKVVPGPAPQDE